MTAALHINDLGNDVLRIILRHTMTAGALQTCHRWRTILLAIPKEHWIIAVNDMIDRASTPHDIHQVPASKYYSLSTINRIRVPNILIAGTDLIIAEGYKYNILWARVVCLESVHIASRSFINYMESCPYSPREGYFYYMFATYEQYRRYILLDVIMLSTGDTSRRIINRFMGIPPMDFARQLWPRCNRNDVNYMTATTLRKMDLDYILL